jgi:uncharacterized protein (TIGR02145 family)
MDKSIEECGHGKLCGITEFPHQGICPNGWHVPTQDEWIQLQDFVGGSYKGYDMLAVDGSGNAKDKYGFGALFTGEFDFRDGYNHSFSSYGAAHFWTATEPDANGAWTWYINGSDFTSQKFDKNMGYAVRCVHD